MASQPRHLTELFGAMAAAVAGRKMSLAALTGHRELWIKGPLGVSQVPYPQHMGLIRTKCI